MLDGVWGGRCSWVANVIASATVFGCSFEGGSVVSASDAASDRSSDTDARGGARSPWVPNGYEVSFAEEFEPGSFALDLDATGASAWAPFWVGWNVRHLAGNRDKALKADVSYVGLGGDPLGIRLHENTPASTLKLFGYPLSAERQAQFHGFPYVAGMISGQLSHQQTYGYWEVRLRVANASIGHHWAVWLVAADNTWPPELDLLEVVGQSPHQFSVNAIGANESGEPVGDIVFSDFPRGENDFYTLGLHWTTDAIAFAIDGDEIHRVASFIEKPLYLIVSPEIGGVWPGLPDATTVWPMEIEIDYIRIYREGKR